MLGFFLKVLVLVITIILIRGSLPRVRLDQLTSATWKSYIFIYLGYFFIVFACICILNYYVGGFFVE